MAGFCGKCGNAIGQNDLFCKRCGTRTRNQADKRQDTTINDHDNKKQHLVYLVEELKKGNDVVFSEFYELTKGYMFFTVSKLINSRTAAEDIIQDSYVIVFKNINTLRDSNAVLKWMGRIAQNNTYKYLRQNEREVLLEEDGSIIENEAESDYTLLPEDAMQNKEVQRLLKEIIDELPKMQRLSIIAYYYNEMNVEEIAETLDIPEGTVKTNLFRARTRIKKAVEELAAKKDTKLYATGLTALLLLSFEKEAKACEVPETLYDSILKNISNNYIVNFPGEPQGLASGNADMVIKSAKKVSKFAGAAAKASIIKKVLILIVSAGAVAGTVGVVSNINKSTPEKTIQKFEESFNEQNLDGMIECFEPDVQTLYSGVMQLASGFANYVSGGMLSISEDLLSLFVEENMFSKSEIKKIEIEVIEVEYLDQRSAEVEAKITLIHDDSSQETSNETIAMIKENNYWYFEVKIFEK